jgi:hypothetical protein
MGKTMLRIVAIVMIVLIVAFSGCIGGDEKPAEVEPTPATPAATPGSPAATPGATPTATPAATPGSPAATPGATPTATPAATPGATPTATPAATPGSPAATPGATPAATPGATFQELIDEALKELPTGNILFNPPKEMKVGDEELVEVRITQNITENLTKGLEGRGDPLINETKVSTTMKVRLTGKNFDIAPQNGAEQIIESDKYTEWKFYVTPLKPGIQTLHLTYYVIISIPGYDGKGKEYEVGDREINVIVNPARFLKSNWQFIVATLLTIVGLIIAVIAIRKKS